MAETIEFPYMSRLISFSDDVMDTSTVPSLAIIATTLIMAMIMVLIVITIVAYN